MNLRIVIIDDDKSHLLIMKHSILKEISNAEISCFTDPIQALKSIERDAPDLIITDYLMPKMDGLMLLKRLKENNLDIPTVVITAHGDEYVAANAIKLGAMEYIVKSANAFDLLPSIVKRVLRERELKEKLDQIEKRLQDIVEKTFNWIWETDRKGYFVYSNPSAQNILGYKIEELLGKRYWEFFPEDERRELIKRFLSVNRNHFFSCEHSFLHKSGRRVILETRLFSIKDKLGEIIGYRGISRDITERYNAEMALKESEERKRLILDASLDWIRHLDKDMRIIWVNRPIREYLNLPIEKIRGAICYEIILGRKSPCEECPLIKSRNTGKVERSIINAKLDNRETYWDVYCVPLKDNNGEIDSFVEVSRNITDQFESEKRIRNLTHQLIMAHEQERKLLSMELHDRIAQNLSLLHIEIDGISQECDLSLTPKIRKIKEILQSTIRNIRNISYDLRPPELDQFGLEKAIFFLCRDISERAGFKVDFSSIGMEDLRLDSIKEINLYRIVQEALMNIEKHAKARNVSVKMVASYPKLIIRIEDDGVGFDVKKELSEASRKKKLGLISMQERAKLIGRDIKISSDKGKGTKLKLEISYGKEKDHYN